MGSQTRQSIPLRLAARRHYVAVAVGAILLSVAVLVPGLTVRTAAASERVQIEAVALAPSETVPVGVPGHWWEVRVLYGAVTGDVDGQLQIAVHRSGRAPLLVSRPVSLLRRQTGTLRSPVFYPAARGLGRVLTVSIRDHHDRLVAQDHAIVTGEGTSVIALVGSRAFPFDSLGKARAHAAALRTFSLGLQTRSTPLPSGSMQTLAARTVRRSQVSAVPLPHHPGCWSGISHVVIEPHLLDSLGPDQTDGLLMWLHWGGTLILSGGPEVTPQLSQLLDRYRPAASRKLAKFTLSVGQPSADADGRPKVVLLGRVLEPGALATVLLRDASGQPIAVQRRVGRGRLVEVAFDLSDPALRDYSGIAELWVRLLLGPGVSPDEQVSVERASRVRYVGRDPGSGGRRSSPAALAPGGPLDELIRRTLYQAVAGRGAVVRTLVAAVLGLYVGLTVLVHVLAQTRRRLWNWGLIPVLSLVTAAGLVAAGLGVGGARGELVVVETFPDLPAVQLTRHIQLLTARRTEVDITFRNRWALPLAWDVEREPGVVQALPGLAAARIRFRPTRLDGVVCYPRAPRHLRVEEYAFPAAPYFVFSQERGLRASGGLVNQSPWDLRDVVLREPNRVCWLTERWKRGEILELECQQPGWPNEERALAGLAARVGDTRIGPFYQLLLASDRAGDRFLVAWAEGTPEGVQYSVALSERFARTIVVLPLAERKQKRP